MQAEFTISIGLNDQDTHTQIISTEDAKDMVFKAFGDCAVLPCIGHYTHDDGSVDIENCFRVYVYADHTEKTRLAGICAGLKKALNQKEIIISWRPCGETAFI